MSLIGLRKQLNKANQYMSEKIGSAEPTKTTDLFIQMERNTDITNEVIEDMLCRTKEYLHPNPAIRVKLSVNSKITGIKKERYPHPELSLGHCMCRSGILLGKESAFGRSLIEMGETLKELTEIKYSLEDTVKQNFLQPLARLQLSDLKDCMHHRKKLEGRRLDFDCKKRQRANGTHVTDQEIKKAEDKYKESLKLSSVAMQTLLDSEREQLAKITALSTALYDYHNQCANILKFLTLRLNRNNEQKKKIENTLNEKMSQIWSSGKESSIKFAEELNGLNGLAKMNKHLNIVKKNNSSGHLIKTKMIANSSRSMNDLLVLKHPVPCAQALYDFKPENSNELAFKEGDQIELKSKVDDNWFEGSINEKFGLFPINYVKVIVPIRH